MNINTLNDTFDNVTFSELSLKAKEFTKNNENENRDAVFLDDSIFLELALSEGNSEKSDFIDSLILEENSDENNLNNAISDEDILFSDESYNRESSQTVRRSLNFSLNGSNDNINNQTNIKNDENKENVPRISEESLSEVNLSKIFESKNHSLINLSNSKISEKYKSFTDKYTPETKELTIEKSVNLSSNDDFKDNLIGGNNQLSSWGLPRSILEKYENLNIKTMFPWQVECLNRQNVLQNYTNLVYSAPTSAGKTLVSEILAIKTIFERLKKVIFILPFVSVVREKTFYFQEILGSSGIRVEGFMGSYNPPGGFQMVQLAICTIEKANSLINKLMLEDNLKDVGAVIIDEMHLLGDPSRGYLLELLLTKLQYISIKNEDIKIQIVGMSATLPNLSLLAKWLRAELFITNFRPIPLHEQLIMTGEIFDSNLKRIRQLDSLPELGTDTDNVLQLCLETVGDSCSVLIFCPTKNWCESLSLQIAQAFWKLGSNNTSQLGQMLRQQLQEKLIVEVLGQLKLSPIGLDEILKKTVSFGVAFHHAGLTMDERDIIENAFRNGAIRVLVATSTLSSGVNLPARRVIVRTVNFHGKPIDSLSYKQMIGRAGRMGKDTMGESFLICQQKDINAAKLLLSTELPPVESCLEGAGKLKRAILEVVASGVASTPEDIKLFTDCTLLNAQSDNLDNPIEESINFLIKNEFIRLSDEKYQATGLGRACLSSSIPPEDGLALFAELEKARECLVLETELHLIYLVTPYSACHQWGNIDWMLYLNLWETLPKSMKKVGELVGVRDAFIINATRGLMQTNNTKSYHKLLVHKRFFVALALQDLVDEKPLGDVCLKFMCNRGMLQSLQQTAANFAGMVTSFSRQLGWSNVEILISQFQDRLQFGVSRDLLDLMRLPILNGKSARVLFNGGIENLIQLANSNVDTIENVLHKVVPFESEKIREGETKFENKQRNKFRNIWITGKEGITEREAAEIMVEGARNYLKDEMGLQEVKWEKESNSKEIITENTNKENSTPKTEEEKTEKDLDLNSSFNLSHLKITSSTETSPLENSSDVINDSIEPLESILTLSTKKRKLSLGYIESPSKRKKTFEEDKDLDHLEVVDACANDRLFEHFSNELKQQNVISLSVACSKVEGSKIGVNLPQDETSNEFIYKNRKVEGIAFSWGSNVATYLKFNEKVYNLVKNLLNNKRIIIKMFDAKEQIKTLKKCCDIDFNAKAKDPKVGDWLLQPEGKLKSLHRLALTYYPKVIKILDLCGKVKGTGSIALDLESTVEPRIRAAIESLATWYITDSVKNQLLEQNPKLVDTVFDTEMSCLCLLAKTEVFGISINRKILKIIMGNLDQLLKTIEIKAFSIAGRRFSFNSSKEVARVLGMFKGRKVSTKKKILEKNEHPIAELVLQWRKIHGIITKMVQPLVRDVKNDRIFGCYVMHTATGRISMQEPSLQNIAKKFEIIDPITENKTEINLRNAFEAKKDHIFLSADYCQLELRLLTHFSQDKILLKIFNQEGDVFKSIAAKWNKISENEVNEELRQRTKQICYGIIYGMGNKALAEQLEIEENEATIFMNSFRNAYPGIGLLIGKIVDECKKKGFVETLEGRRRYLPHINDTDPGLRGQAERQAVNTTIQGSAADIVKSAMINLESNFSKYKKKPNLVLHLHDELIYEVPLKYLSKVATILKTEMENSVKLSIPFPVKLKSGLSWGQLTELKL